MPSASAVAEEARTREAATTRHLGITNPPLMALLASRDEGHQADLSRSPPGRNSPEKAAGQPHLLKNIYSKE